MTILEKARAVAHEDRVFMWHLKGRAAARYFYNYSNRDYARRIAYRLEDDGLVRVSGGGGNACVELTAKGASYLDALMEAR